MKILFPIPSFIKEIEERLMLVFLSSINNYYHLIHLMLKDYENTWVGKNMTYINLINTSEMNFFW